MAQTNLSMNEKQTDIQNKDTALGRWDQESGTSNCKLLYTEQINSKVLCSTGNCIQYPVANRNGKEHENECVCVYICTHIYTCITELLCCAPKANTTQ